MAVEIIMPKAGMAMEEGTVIKWLKKIGEHVDSGEPLLEIETDKTSMEVESPAAGYLIKTLKDAGDVVPVTQVIGYLGELNEKVDAAAGTPVSAIDSASAGDAAKAAPAEESKAQVVSAAGARKLASQGGKVAATPAARRIALEKGIDLGTIAGSGSFGEIKAADVLNVRAVNATPLARRIAEDQNIDLENIRGSGINGKIRKEDLGLAPAAQKAEAQPAVKAEAVNTGKPTAARKPMKGMRKVIMDRMLKSHLEIPPVTLNMKADVTELVALREKLNNTLGMKISINDFILRATAMALSESPNINVSLEGNEVVYKTEINVGMAVALEDGLIVPVIRDADKLSLVQIAAKSKELAGKAKNGGLLPDDYTGGTFTVSNLGMFDVLSFTPIINQPEAAILGACAIDKELKMIDDKIESRSMMGLSLTFDHRLVDGAQAAQFLKKIKLLLQEPLRVVV